MKPFLDLKKSTLAILLTLAVFGTMLQTGCTEHPISTFTKPAKPLSSYIVPVTVDTFNVGLIHNAMLYYIFTHYDTTQYASYTNKFSQTGIDSLAHLFIADSIQPTTGSFSPVDIAMAEVAFDSVFNAGSTALPSYSALVATVDTAQAHNIFSADEASFILTADTDIRLCTSYTQVNDTISSLISQYNSMTWAPSTSHGVAAYEYLSIAKHSSALWGQPGDTILPIAAHPIISDDDAWMIEWLSLQYLVPSAMSEAESINIAGVVADAASGSNGTGPAGLGPTGLALVRGTVITTIVYLVYLLYVVAILL